MLLGPVCVRNRSEIHRGNMGRKNINDSVFIMELNNKYLKLTHNFNTNVNIAEWVSLFSFYSGCLKLYWMEQRSNFSLLWKKKTNISYVRRFLCGILKNQIFDVFVDTFLFQSCGGNFYDARLFPSNIKERWLKNGSMLKSKLNLPSLLFRRKCAAWFCPH